ncbi:MAG: sulfatase [Candidatus Omnitrophica bacterium]|nr:sulfatase-like hydrolase/transferase [Candidatus Omnitrophota bacterium]MDD3274292.1 sulfatase [Candidatus Omnitrophota bacterium]MDD5078104.1 sulfatase [Candidatus Omnitrophota bacterium]MDD5724803.1 sulfatase [Candidatus Omnitrophota bacterium]
MNRKRRLFLFFIPFLILFISGGLQGCRGRNRVSPGAYAGDNVILVSFDALQAAHTGCLGYFRDTTPNIDRITKGGFLFKNAVAQSSWTVPSTMSYFTSLYPSQHKLLNKYSTYTEEEKIFSNLKKLSPEVVTLAEVLRENGYCTGGFTGDAGVGAVFGYGQGFDTYFEGPKFGGMDRSIPAALEWLKRNGKKRFFIFLHGYDVHGQFDPPGGFSREFVNPPYLGELKGGKEEEARIREEGLEGRPVELTDEDVRFWRALYDEKIKDVDERFGFFIDALDKMGLLENTIIVLFSDHGTEFYEHKRFDHGFSLYEELIRVPLVFRLPQTRGGAVITGQVRAIDVMPTVLDLLGIKVSDQVRKQMQGVSLIPSLNGKKQELKAFSETDYRFYVSKRSVRTPEGLKFIYSLDTGNKELYNLKDDPRELNNLAGVKKRAAYELEQELFGWLKEMGSGEEYHRRMIKKVLKIKEY